MPSFSKSHLQIGHSNVLVSLCHLFWIEVCSQDLPHALVKSVLVVRQAGSDLVGGNGDGISVELLVLAAQSYVRDTSVVDAAVVAGKMQAQVRHVVEPRRPERREQCWETWVATT